MIQVNCSAVVHLTNLFVPRDDRAAAGRRPDCFVRGGISGRSVQSDLCGHKGI